MIFKMYLEKIFRRLSPRATVLIYHRVAKVREDPHLLSVSPKNFEAQIKYLSQNFHLVGLADISKKHNLIGHNKENIAITFDDGYQDNYYNALPILKKYSAPATIFVATNMINSNNPYYWEEQTRPVDQGKCMTVYQLKQLDRESLITIGAHTRSHPQLIKLSRSRQLYEIRGSKKDLEKILNHPVESFSYPFGGYSDISYQTINIVKQSGFKYAAVNWSGNMTLFENIYTIPRIIIRNWDLKTFVNYLHRKV